MNRIAAPFRTASRPVAAALAIAATLLTLQSIDTLASRNHGDTLMARAAVQVVGVASALRQGARRS